MIFEKDELHCVKGGFELAAKTLIWSFFLENVHSENIVMKKSLKQLFEAII